MEFANKEYLFLLLLLIPYLIWYMMYRKKTELGLFQNLIHGNINMEEINKEYIL